MDEGPELGQRLGMLYVAVRDSATVDRQAAFDIAMNESGSRGWSGRSTPCGPTCGRPG